MRRAIARVFARSGVVERRQTRLETSCTRTGRPRRHLLPNLAAGRRAKAQATQPRMHISEESPCGECAEERYARPLFIRDKNRMR